jgi:HAD superfamily hydrolase (TIGR01509 family)
MRIEALIFDLDGVLADTEPLHAAAWDSVIQGISPEIVIAERSKWIGMPSVDIARELIRAFSLQQSIEELLRQKRAAYRSLVRRDLRPFPGLPRELERWKGFPLAVATSGIRSEALLVLDILGLADTFDHVVTVDDVPKAKPAPDCYLRAAEILGKNPPVCAAIEDSFHGLQAAVEAGMHVYVVSPFPLSPIPRGVEGIFASTVEALRILWREANK